MKLQSILLLSLAMVPATAATKYVRQGATGSTCADWANACNTLPSSLTRGDTIYVATGNYGSYTFSTAASGSTVITIKKATVADHGTATGWSDTYGTGQAVWTGWTISSDNWVFDGTTGGGPSSWSQGHGLAVRALASHLALLSGNRSNITMTHVELDGTSNSPGDRDAFYAINGGSNITLQYMYIHDIGCDMFQIRDDFGPFTVEYSKFTRNNQDAACHGDVFEYDSGTASGWVHRYNWFADVQGTYLWGTHETGILSGAQIYGNVISRGLMDNGMIAGLSGGGKVTGLRFYNNTIASLSGAAGFLYLDRGTDNQIMNNIWYNSSPNMQGTHDYNWFFGAGSQSESHIQTGGGNPFVNLGSDDYRLAGETSAGTALPGYGQDLLGNTRGADGKWDRGAYEYGGTPAQTALPMTNMAVTTVL